MNFRDWDWDKLDEIAASFARPYQQYVCSSAIAVSLLWAMYNRADAMVIGALAIPCAGLAGWSANLRSVDKKTAATTEIAKSSPKPDTTVSAEIK